MKNARATKRELPEWAKNLRIYRQQWGLSQEEFGRRFGVTRMAVSYWESAQAEPPVRVLAWLLEASGTIDGGIFFKDGVMKDAVWENDEVRH